MGDIYGIIYIEPASTIRILAHELGHQTGVLDDGPEKMNNINIWENPIMSEIDGKERVSYSDGIIMLFF